MANEFTGQEIKKKFLACLSEADSNLPEMGKGDQVYQHWVKPKCVTHEKVVNHFAISSLLDDGGKGKKIFSYGVEKIRYERMEKGACWLVIGQVRGCPLRLFPSQKNFFLD